MAMALQQGSNKSEHGLELQAKMAPHPGIDPSTVARQATVIASSPMGQKTDWRFACLIISQMLLVCCSQSKLKNGADRET